MVSESCSLSVPSELAHDVSRSPAVRKKAPNFLDDLPIEKCIKCFQLFFAIPPAKKYTGNPNSAKSTPASTLGLVSWPRFQNRGFETTPNERTTRTSWKIRMIGDRQLPPFCRMPSRHLKLRLVLVITADRKFIVNPSANGPKITIRNNFERVTDDKSNKEKQCLDNIDPKWQFICQLNNIYFPLQE